jgi:hypothetical protein
MPVSDNVPHFMLLKDVLPRNGFSWPHGSRTLSRALKDAAISRVLREQVSKFQRKEIEPC